jgi:hypothetical protein
MLHDSHLIPEIGYENTKQGQRRHFKDWLSISGKVLAHIFHPMEHQFDFLGFNRIPYPAYLSDISPCNFWFFGFANARFKRRQTMNGQELLGAIMLEVDETKLCAMYKEWIQRSKDVIGTSGEFLPRES